MVLWRLTRRRRGRAELEVFDFRGLVGCRSVDPGNTVDEFDQLTSFFGLRWKNVLGQTRDRPAKREAVKIDSAAEVGERAVRRAPMHSDRQKPGSAQIFWT